jgi:translation elongation factor EF-Tu-like GTPase
MFAPSTNFEQVKKYHEENNTGIVIKEMKYNYETDEYEYID